MNRNPDGTVAQQTLHSGAAGTAVIDQWDYTYDSTGWVASKARSGSAAGTVSEVHGYDEAGRVATINAGQIDYDPNGNRLSGPGMPTLTFRADNSTATGPDETGSGSEAYLHAPWGGLTRDACRSYGYDGFDRSRTTTIRKRALDLLPRCNIVEDLAEANNEKRYDALGRNTWARHDSLNLLGDPTSTDYVHLHHVGLGQDVVVEQTVGAPARSGRYINTPGGTPLAVVDGNDDREFLHRDGQNDTVLAVGDNGQVACAPNLSVSGESDIDCDDPLLPESANRKWYNSSRLDPATDTYQWGERTYNPTTATWQQPDTPALSGGPSQVSIGTDPLVANRYAYVNGDPINLWDPTGHDPDTAAWVRDRQRQRSEPGPDDWSDDELATVVELLVHNPELASSEERLEIARVYQALCVERTIGEDACSDANVLYDLYYLANSQAPGPPIDWGKVVAKGAIIIGGAAAEMLCGAADVAPPVGIACHGAVGAGGVYLWGVAEGDYSVGTEEALGAAFGAAGGTVSRWISTAGTSSVAAPRTAGLADDVLGLSDDALQGLTASQRRSVRSLQTNIAEHKAKLAAYVDDPYAYDNLGHLAKAPSDAVRQSIIQGRVRHLENEITAFADQIRKLTGGG